MRFSSQKRIVYVVPHVRISGGVAVVLQHAVRLRQRGFDVVIINLSGEGDASWFLYHKEIEIIAFEHKPLEAYKNIDALIATSWDTVEAVEKIFKAKQKIYFVQSDERRFTSDREIQQKIHQTYTSDVTYMTEALWIQRWLKEEFGHDAYYVPNGLDEKIFYPTQKRKEKRTKVRVLLEGPMNIPFKGMQDAYDAVKDLDCELWIISSRGKPPKDWHYDQFFECVPMHEMKEIYSQCDIFLKMSRVEGFFGPPLEAMACACAVVVGKCTGYDEYIVDGENALVVEQSDISGAKEAVQKLIDDSELRKKLIKNGTETAKAWSWDRSVNFLQKVFVFFSRPKQYWRDKFLERYTYDTCEKND